MRILSIDPGYERLGAAVLEGERGKEHVVTSCCIQTSARHSFPERLAQIDAEMTDYISAHKPEACAIETIAFGVNQKTALLVAAARGVVVAAAARAHLPVYEYTPQDIKIAVTGHGASDKKQVTTMVARLVSNAPERAYDDVYDAIAVGVTHINSIQTLSAGQ